MAWTEQCKIDAKAQIEKRKEEVGSIRKACHSLSRESGIPASTLKHWYCSDGKVDENSSTQPTKTKEKTPEQFWVAIGKKVKRIREEVQAFDNYEISPEVARAFYSEQLALLVYVCEPLRNLYMEDGNETKPKRGKKS